MKNFKIDNVEEVEAEQIKMSLIYNAIQLNEHLSEELSNIQNEKHSKITTRVINLASATAVISELAFSKLPDTDTVIQNSMSH
ncbi:MAG: hypothetical protein ACTH54_03175 [Vagococcus salmoninarum]|uniref:hypothetical protein n=1 Tax=Vagococcus salmoninarum TaxID=2739 RepID=UPI003F975E8E